MQAHPRNLGGDRRNLDAVIDLASLLRALRDVGPAAVAHARPYVALTRRIGMQRPMCARMRLLLAAALDELGRLLVALARRDARIVRRLRRTIRFGLQLSDLRLERDHLRAQPLDRLRLRQGDANHPFPIQRIKDVTIHPTLESDLDSRVKFSAKPADNTGGEQLPRKWRRNGLKRLIPRPEMAPPAKASTTPAVSDRVDPKTALDPSRPRQSCKIRRLTH